MLRLLLAIVIALGMTSTAWAETDLVVLGPAAPEGTPRAVIDDIKRAIEHAGLKSGVEIGPSCAVDVVCLKATAAENTARRALAVSAELAGKHVKISLVLVDVVANEQLGKRDHVLAPDRKSVV